MTPVLPMWTCVATLLRGPIEPEQLGERDARQCDFARMHDQDWIRAAAEALTAAPRCPRSKPVMPGMAARGLEVPTRKMAVRR